MALLLLLFSNPASNINMKDKNSSSDRLHRVYCRLCERDRTLEPNESLKTHDPRLRSSISLIIKYLNREKRTRDPTAPRYINI